MKTEIELTKTERKLQFFLILSALLSFIVIGFGVYFQNNNIDKDYILVPLLLGFWFIFFGISVYNGFSDGNLIKKWTPFYIYNPTLWFVAKINSDRQKAEKIATRITSLIALIIYLFLLFTFLKSLNS